MVRKKNIGGTRLHGKFEGHKAEEREPCLPPQILGVERATRRKTNFAPLRVSLGKRDQNLSDFVDGLLEFEFIEISFYEPLHDAVEVEAECVVLHDGFDFSNECISCPNYSENAKRISS
jgi:hypothetical protein